MSLEFTFIDNSDAVIAELQRKRPIALEAVGSMAESYTKGNITAAGRVSPGGGSYRQSITHTVKDDEVYIGSNLNYALYNELGTGSYASNEKGRKGWWVYVAGQDAETAAAHRNPESASKVYTKAQAYAIMMSLRAKGLDARMTNGIKPIHALQKAVSDHQSNYAAQIEDILKI